eukprot:5552624-Alexandrium_andersonii.AAC.1
MINLLYLLCLRAGRDHHHLPSAQLPHVVQDRTLREVQGALSSQVPRFAREQSAQDEPPAGSSG